MVGRTFAPRLSRPVRATSRLARPAGAPRTTGGQRPSTARAATAPEALSAPDLLDLQRAIGNRAVTETLVQRLRSMSDVNPPGLRVTPQQALLNYIGYLVRETYHEGLDPESADPIRRDLDRIRALVVAQTVWTADAISVLRKEIDGVANRLRHAFSSIPDSDITPAYAPLKGCVLQALAQGGFLGMSAAQYHAQLWETNDDFKYYDMDTSIGPLYKRFGLTEVACSEKYGDLIEKLAPGTYILNVASPAGPNGHMFVVEISTKNGPKGMRNVAVVRQDDANRQSWADGDKILRYWKK